MLQNFTLKHTHTCWKRNTRLYVQHQGVTMHFSPTLPAALTVCGPVLDTAAHCCPLKWLSIPAETPPKMAPHHFNMHICSSPVRLPRLGWQLHWCGPSHLGSRTCRHTVPSSSWWDPVGHPQPGWHSARLQHLSQSMGFCTRGKKNPLEPIINSQTWVAAASDRRDSIQYSEYSTAEGLESVPLNIFPMSHWCWRERCVQQDILQMFTNICFSRRTDLAWHFPAQTWANNAATAFLTNTPGRGSSAGGRRHIHTHTFPPGRGPRPHSRLSDQSGHICCHTGSHLDFRSTHESVAGLKDNCLFVCFFLTE